MQWGMESKRLKLDEDLNGRTTCLRYRMIDEEVPVLPSHIKIFINNVKIKKNLYWKLV